MTVRILACAEAEFAEAVQFFNDECPGLGYEFAAEVKAAFSRIADFPNAWPFFSRRARRCIVNRFPYGILYQAREDGVLVVAIMHLKRDPERWQDRASAAEGESGPSRQ